jgi:UDP-N-acetylmuramate--alanine ligase
MTDLENIKNIYFIGIGGIGMSALARYFNERGVTVGGYDRSRSVLTEKMEQEGIMIEYDLNAAVPDKAAELVVYTPAIAGENKILKWYRDNNFPVLKRSDVLQQVTRDMKCITVAGTHGKTTISTLIAHILRDAGFGCNAFLGGIATNYVTNYWSSENPVAVIEADEYDRSFLKLNPDIAVLTSMSADHLDIYGTEEALEEAFIQYTENIKPEGTLWYKFGLKRGRDLKAAHRHTYSLQNSGAESFAQNILMQDGGYIFDVFGDGWILPELQLNLGGMHNVENCVVAVSVAKQLGLDDFLIKDAVAKFRGVKRRFQYVIKNERIVYIDDYAHHPEELASLIKSAKVLFPYKRCIIVFQPHLYSRTRDLAEGFAHSLDLADQVILLDIYPAREQPIEGISAQTIADKMANPNHTILSKEGLLKYAATAPLELFITAGAGDIDQLMQPIKEAILKRNKI